LHQVGDLFELNVKLRFQKDNTHANSTANIGTVRFIMHRAIM